MKSLTNFKHYHCHSCCWLLA